MNKQNLKQVSAATLKLHADVCGARDDADDKSAVCGLKLYGNDSEGTVEIRLDFRDGDGEVPSALEIEDLAARLERLAATLRKYNHR